MKKTRIIVSTIIIICLLTACNQNSMQKRKEVTSTSSFFNKKKELSSTFFALDTVNSITIYDGASNQLLSDCEKMVKDYENLFSRTIPDSEIYKLNHASGDWVTVSDDTLSLIKLAIYYCDLSDGALDITIASAKDLWDFSGESTTIPTQEALKEAVRHVSYRQIEIEGNQIRLLDPDASIDLGCIAKGYIADRLRDYLVQKGVRSALINLGGNVEVIGEKPDHSCFKIGIQKPFSKTGDYITTVELSDLSTEEMTPSYRTAVTSGSYERCFTKDGKLYHHILDPKTGYPADSDLSSVTIICDQSAVADALSTACLTLGFEKAEKLIGSQYGIKAILIKTSGEVIEVYGMPDA